MNKIKYIEPEINVMFIDNDVFLTDSGWSSPVLPPKTNGYNDTMDME